MSMSTHVVGFRPPDEKWKRMKAVWDACEAARIKKPQDVLDFFESVDPDPSGVEVEQSVLEKAGAVKRWHHQAHACAGFEIEVAKLPKDVKILRVYNSW